MRARTSPSSTAGLTATTIGSRPSRPIWYDDRVVAIAAAGFVGAQAAKAATATIPVVFASGVDPVAAGVVASLNRPGGNVTGVSLISQELAAKRLELLRELMPQARVIALLINPDNPATGTELTDAEAPARTLGLQIRKVTASNERDLDAAFATMQTPRVDALIVARMGTSSTGATKSSPWPPVTQCPRSTLGASTRLLAA